MDDLRLALIVIGVFAILGTFVHGIWTIRKNASGKDKKRASSRKEPRLNESEQEPIIDDSVLEIPEDDPLLDEVYPDSDGPEKVGFDADGIGQVRVVKTTVIKPNETPEPEVVTAKKALDDAIDKNIETADSAPVSAVQQPKGHGADTVQAEDMPEPPSSLLKDEPQIVKKEPEKKEGIAEKAKKLVTKNTEKKEKRSRIRKEPKIGEDQIRLDLDESIEPAIEESSQTIDEPAAPVEQEVLVLNIKTPDSNPISGAALLPALLTLGFKFGEQDVFHRHANSNGKGPQLFSLANMFKPGTFDLDNMETFTTQGLSLFMILPIEGDAHQVFNMMHNAARKLADEFGAQVLDSRRSLLTKQSLQQYVEKIREFERRRMIRRA